MKTTAYVFCLLATWTASVLAQDPAKPAAHKDRVGIYDSRAVAVAWFFSPGYEASEGRKGRELEAAARQARADGDAKRVAEAEAALKKAVDTVAIPRHKQVFSTAPVDDLLANIKDEMPALMKAAGVEKLVSKWDRAGLAKCGVAERVDVTMALVRALNPTEKQLKAAIDIQTHDPIPLAQAEKMDWSKE